MKYKLSAFSNDDYSTLGNKLAICYVVNSLDEISDCYRIHINESSGNLEVDVYVKINSGLLIDDMDFIANKVKEYLIHYFEDITDVTTHINQAEE
ncbi:MAG: cation transporter dimerization domain-containing protein [Methanohalobium sp.]|uniref:cation transporter dimerization domain-containing protein n=1 Tax=Methanohalobium sp. TaxID=2837493 RepID=UPI0039786FB4